MNANARNAMGLVAAWILYSFALGALHLVTPPNPDSSIFDYMSWRSLEGDRLYVDVTEQNWPGAVWVHMLSTVMSGNSLWSFRLLDYLLLLAACLALFQLGRFSGFTWTCVVAPPLYQMMYVTSTPWLTGQRDAIAAHILLVTCAVYVSLRGAWRPWWMVLLGSVWALVVMIRPTYLLFPALILLGELFVVLRRDDAVRRRKLIFGACAAATAFLGVLLALAVVGMNTGGLRGWYEAAILYNLNTYSGSASVAQVLQTLMGTVAMWHWYFAFAIIGTVIWYTKGNRTALLLMLGLGITCMVSFLVQGKAFGYHLAPLLPILALFSAQTIAWAVEVVSRHRRQWIWLGIALVLLATALAGSARKLRAIAPQAAYVTGKIDRHTYLAASEFRFEGVSMADALAVATYIESRTDAAHTVLVWNRGVLINFLAKRPLPVPFATVGALLQLRDEDGPMGNWVGQLRRVLACSPPKYIVVGDEWQLADSLTESVHFDQAPQADQLVAAALKLHYQAEIEIGGARLWRLEKSPELSCR